MFPGKIFITKMFTAVVVLSLFACASSLPMKQVDDAQIKALPSSGHTVLIHFWATWCQPCVAEIPVLNRLNERYHPDVQFIAINMDDLENRGAIPGFLKNHPIDFSIVLRDGKNFEAMAQTLDPEWKAGLPATFVFHDGNRVFSKIGMVDEKELDAVLRHAAGKSKS